MLVPYDDKSQAKKPANEASTVASPSPSTSKALLKHVDSRSTLSSALSHSLKSQSKSKALLQGVDSRFSLSSASKTLQPLYPPFSAQPSVVPSRQSALPLQTPSLRVPNSSVTTTSSAFKELQRLTNELKSQRIAKQTPSSSESNSSNTPKNALRQRLIFHGKAIPAGKSLLELGIGKDATLHVQGALLGGGSSKIWSAEWANKYAEDGIVEAATAQKFHCTACDKDYALGSMGESAILQHIGKESHKRKLDPGDVDEWDILLARYEEDGIRQSESPDKFFCAVCKKDYAIGRMKESAITQHLSSDRHHELVVREQNWAEQYGAQGIIPSNDSAMEFYCQHCNQAFQISRKGPVTAIEQHLSSRGHQTRLNVHDALNDAMDNLAIDRLDGTAVWNRRKLFRTCFVAGSAVKWCQELGLLPTRKKCPQGHLMEPADRFDRGFPQFRCRVAGCNERCSIANGTWLEGVHFPIEKIVSLMYSYASGDSYYIAIREAITDDGTKLSRESVADWFNYCREIVFDSYLSRVDERGKIGGEGKIVQIDEAKVGVRKFNKGRKVEGHWILGMIEDGSEDLRIAVCPNNRRRAEDLLPAIEKHVEKGTIIRTDCWKAYNRLPELGYVHQSVNHSVTFVTDAGVHTNRIESSWRPLKDHFRKIKIRSVCKDCQAKFNDASIEAGEDDAQRRDLYKQIREERADCEGCKEHENSFAVKLVEYLWRREIRKKGLDPFEVLLNAVRDVYTVD